MPRSLTRGDYALVAWVESPRTPGQWYRVLADVRAPQHLSCDCPIWVFGRLKQDGVRVCKHTLWAEARTWLVRAASR